MLLMMKREIKNRGPEMAGGPLSAICRVPPQTVVGGLALQASRLVRL